MLETGRYATIKEIARAEKINPSYPAARRCVYTACRGQGGSEQRTGAFHEAMLDLGQPWGRSASICQSRKDEVSGAQRRELNAGKFQRIVVVQGDDDPAHALATM